MPTSTFFNLPPPKREKLFRAAVAEFARQPYGEVSLSQVIKAAGIPRGSFYQYFAGKTDLFRYVIGYYGERLEALVLESLDSCGGQLLELPLALFARMRERFRMDDQEFQAFLGVIRQNVAVDVGQIWNFQALMTEAIKRTDWSGLRVNGRGEQLALLDLLLSSTAHALMTASCGRTPPEQCREHLVHKVALIRRGLEIKDPLSSCVQRPHSGY